MNNRRVIASFRKRPGHRELASRGRRGQGGRAAGARRARARGPDQRLREEQVFWLGEIQGALKAAPGGTQAAERVTGDRFEQERLNPPVLGGH